MGSDHASLLKATGEVTLTKEDFYSATVTAIQWSKRKFGRKFQVDTATRFGTQILESLSGQTCVRWRDRGRPIPDKTNQKSRDKPLYDFYPNVQDTNRGKKGSRGNSSRASAGQFPLPSKEVYRQHIQENTLLTCFRKQDSRRTTYPDCHERSRSEWTRRGDYDVIPRDSYNTLACYQLS